MNTGVQRHREAAVSESGVSAGKVQDASRRRAHIPPALSVSTDSGPSAPDCSWAELKGSALSVTFSLFIRNGRGRRRMEQLFGVGVPTRKRAR